MCGTLCRGRFSLLWISLKWEEIDDMTDGKVCVCAAPSAIFSLHSIPVLFADYSHLFFFFLCLLSARAIVCIKLIYSSFTLSLFLSAHSAYVLLLFPPPPPLLTLAVHAIRYGPIPVLPGVFFRCNFSIFGAQFILAGFILCGQLCPPFFLSLFLCGVYLVVTVAIAVVFSISPQSSH